MMTDDLTKELPDEIEKWLCTIEAHCTVIGDPDTDDDVKVLAKCIKLNVGDVRALLTAELTRLQLLIAEKDEALEPFSNDFNNRKHLTDYPIDIFTETMGIGGSGLTNADLRRAAKAKELK